MSTQTTPTGSQATEAASAGAVDSTLDAALAALLDNGHNDAERWGELIKSGATDGKIKSTLTFLIGPYGRADSSKGIALIQTKPKLAFWFGSYGVGKPASAGDALIEKVREVLSIPPPDLDLVPDDPHRRNWSSLSDAELIEWRGALMAVKGDYAREQLDRVNAVIARRETEQLPTEAEVLAAHQAKLAQQSAEAETDEMVVETTEQVVEAIAPRDETMAEQMSLFNYAQLPDEDADVVRRCTREIRERVVSTLNNMLVIGQRLREVKATLGRGHFTEWLAKEIGFSQDSSERYIRLADYVDQNPHFAEILSRFDKTAAHLLLAPSTPEEAREEAIARAESGERITSAKAKEIVESHRPEESAVEAESDDTGVGVADYSTSDEVENKATAESEIVATGRSSSDLLALLRSSPDGMAEDDLVKMGFSATLLERARTEGLAAKHLGGNWFYKWKGEDVVGVIREKGPLSRTAIEAMGCEGLTIRMAERDGLIKRGPDGRFVIATTGNEARPTAAAKPDKHPAAIEDLLKGKTLAITYTYLSALKGKVVVGVCVGDDKSSVLVDTLDSSKVKHASERVQEMIVAQIKAADKGKGDAGVKAQPKKAGPARQAKPAARAASSTKKVSTKKASSKPAPKKAPAAKKGVAAKKKGGGVSAGRATSKAR